MIGGGAKAMPGEISLAHHGTLFLDELLEYPRTTLESLRQPLEDKQITISRAQGKYYYPANFMLVATMNPCPCGYLGDPEKSCHCSSTQILNYQKRLSGPLLDRIDLTINVSRVAHEDLLSRKSSSDSQQKQFETMIKAARTLQTNRYGNGNKYNADIDGSSVDKITALTTEAKQFLLTAAKKLDLSARGYFKVIKVARTIADLESSLEITIPHVAESLQYRQIIPT